MDRALQTGVIAAGGSFEASSGETAGLPDVSFYRNRYYDQRSGRWLTEDPIGVAGGANLYLYAGNNPVTLSDPFGLCPEKYKKDKEACDTWNKMQVESAVEIIETERVNGNADALAVDVENVIGMNSDQIQGACGNQTRTGCSDTNTIGVNADRDPAAIAQTIVHERQHQIGGGLESPPRVPGTEQCARFRAARFVRSMSRQNKNAALADNFVYTIPMSAPQCGF